MAALAFAALAAALIAVLATRDQDDGNRVASPLIGRQVPHVAGAVLTGPDADGPAAAGPAAAGAVVRFDIDADADRWILVNFFASWCAPCRREHPELVEWSGRHRYDGRLVSVPFGDTDEGAIGFFDEFGGDWPLLSDADARWAVAFGVLRPPESFLVAPGGTVVARWQGRITADEVDRVIAAATSA
ncbi:MAG TPA: hypothetical protein DEP69_01210 [Acidimicrobiaceae bacterium]|nr:hypothetical protein [Acidimicrobiaceae bacterium]